MVSGFRYRVALETEPTLWAAFERLSALTLIEGGNKQTPQGFAQAYFGKPVSAQLWMASF